MPPIRSFEETYRVVKKHAEERIEELRGQLESMKLTETETAARRGRIAELRVLLRKMEEEAHV